VKWPQFSIQALVPRLAVRANSGVSCVYVRWSKRAGLKIFVRRTVRDYAAQAQRLAAEVGAAPRAGPSFSFRCPSIACRPPAPGSPVLDDTGRPSAQVVNCYCYWTEHADPAPSPIAPWLTPLRRTLRGIGVRHNDLRKDNIGTLPDGRVVCIDFDTASCEVTHLHKRLRGPRQRTRTAHAFY
jgi:hypothetical protein